MRYERGRDGVPQIVWEKQDEDLYFAVERGDVFADLCYSLMQLKLVHDYIKKQQTVHVASARQLKAALLNFDFYYEELKVTHRRSSSLRMPEVTIDSVLEAFNEKNTNYVMDVAACVRSEQRKAMARLYNLDSASYIV
ncbi:MAG: hypothetical protein V1837_04835 [Candidatus Woesearchaeota archaeon]